MKYLTFERTESKLKITFFQKIFLEINLRSRITSIIVSIILSLLKDEHGKKLLTQKEIGEMVGYSRQTTNYTIKSFKEGGYERAIKPKEYESDIFTKNVKRELKDIWFRNPFLKAREVINVLKELFPHLKTHNITPAQLSYHINQDISFEEIRRTLKKQYNNIGKGTLEHNSEYLIESLIKLLSCSDESKKSTELEKLKAIFNVEKLVKKISTYRTSITLLFNKLINPLNGLYASVVLFYFQTSCSMRTAADYFNISQSKVCRIIEKVGEAEPIFSTNIGINKDIRIIGIDEKWIKIKGTKNKWSYLFIAVDIDSRDILYTHVFEERSDTTIKIFLLGLKNRGYNPDFIVTDLLKAYNRIIPQIFGKRIKHIHCLIHFMKNLLKHFKDVYGNDFKKKKPHIYIIYKQFRNIFRCKTPKTARNRYFAAMKLYNSYPEAEKIFLFIRKHFRHLMYSKENTGVPQTNNVTETIIKRFAKHIKNCNGFESVKTAQLYFRAFQIVYRMTPFRKDNKNVEIRGKLPVELSFAKFTKNFEKCQISL